MALSEQDKRLLDIEAKKAEEEDNKIFTEEDLRHQKKYLIEEVLSDGELLVKESNSEVKVDYETPYYKMVNEYYELDQKENEVTKSPQKKSFWSRFFEALFG